MYVQKFVNVGWALTFLIFFGVLMLAYAYLPDQLNWLNEAGFSLTRETFFYGVLALFVVINLAALLLRRMLEALPLSASIYRRNEAFKERLIAWFGGLMSAINVCIISLVGYLSLAHNQEDFSIDIFSFLIYLGPALLLLCIFWLFGVLSSRQRYELNQ